MSRASLLAALPQVFVDAHVEGSPLAALIAAADGMQHPVAEVLDHLETAVDPFRAGDAMVCYLASWVDLDWLTIPEGPHLSRSTLPGGVAPLRDLIASAADLSARRGTAAGIVRFLELATRVTGYEVTDAGDFRIVIGVPAEAEPQRDAIARIVAVIKPAHVTAELSPAPTEPGEPTPTVPEEPHEDTSHPTPTAAEEPGATTSHPTPTVPEEPHEDTSHPTPTVPEEPREERARRHEGPPPPSAEESP